MLTVLVATRNGAAVLRDTLEAFCHLQPPSSGWKMVVVDNGSTDETPAVLASFEKRLPLQVLSEPRGGQNSARNTGIEFLEGDLTVFTDDDTFPDPGWLVELRNASDAHPEYSIFGGVIVPRWESAPPRWVEWLPEKGPVYGLTFEPLREGPMPPNLVFSGNMAIRTAIFQSGMRFDALMGPGGTSHAMGSETQLTLLLARQGHKCWHVPGAVVAHFIRDYQICASWARNRAVRYGRGRFRLRELEQRPEGLSAWFVGPQWFGVPRKIFRGMAREVIRASVAVLTRKERALFSARWKLHFLWGSVIEARASYHARRQGAAADNLGTISSTMRKE
jgi:L-malate glycosyltransferase